MLIRMFRWRFQTGVVCTVEGGACRIGEGEDVKVKNLCSVGWRIGTYLYSGGFSWCR